MQWSVTSGSCFATNGSEFDGGGTPKAPANGERGRSITAREGPPPVSWSNRAELHALVGKLPAGERFAFFCRNIEDLTHDDVRESSVQLISSPVSDVESADLVLIMALSDALKRKKMKWRSLPYDLFEEFDLRNLIDMLLQQLCRIAHNFDSALSWNLFPIALRGFENSDARARIKAADLAVIFEANLTGSEAQIAREALINALSVEGNPHVRSEMIRCFGEIGARDSHSNHEILAGVVAEYLADDDEGVRIQVIQALVKIAPHVEGDEGESVNKNLQILLHDRIEEEKSALVREWLRTAVAQLDGQLRGGVPKVPAKGEAGRSITAREGPQPVAWSNREELLAIVEKISVGQRFAFLCRNIESLTLDDVVELLVQLQTYKLGHVAHAEYHLISLLRRQLKREQVKWSSLADALWHEIDLFNDAFWLGQFCEVAPHFDSQLSWNLFPIALRGLGNSNPKIRMKAANLVTVFEANLAGVQARMAREELMQALEKEKDPKVCASLIQGLGEIGSRDDHSDHKTLADLVVEHLADDDNGVVRLEVIQALVKMTPHLEGDKDRNISDLLNLLLARFGDEWNDMVHRELRVAIAYLTGQLSGDVRDDYLETLFGSLKQKAAQGRRHPPGPQADRIRAVDMLKRLGGRSSALDNKIAAALEEFWKDIEPGVREAAFEAWAEVIQNLEPEQALERVEALKKMLTKWSSDVVHLVAVEGLGKLIPLLDVEKRYYPFGQIHGWMWMRHDSRDDDDLKQRAVRVLADNLENLKPSEQQVRAGDLLWFLWEDNRHIVRQQSDDVLNIFENIGRHLSAGDLNDLIGEMRQENSASSYEKILAVLISLPQRRHYEAAVIRAAVRRAGVLQTADDGRGYLNRGLHKGNRPTRGGFDFRDLREVRPGEPIGRIDPAATARTGNVHERVFHQEQSRPVMIIVDPESFWESDWNALRYLVGTLAQFASAHRDPVGLVIGMGEVYIKPSYGRDRLFSILTALYNYDKVFHTVFGVLPLLEQRAVRMNMPRGAEVILVSPFAYDDLDGVERVIGRLKRRGVNVRPVKAGNAYAVKEPVIEMGGIELKVDPQLVERKAAIEAEGRRDRCERFLKGMGGFYFDLSGVRDVADIAAWVAQDLRRGQEISIESLQIKHDSRVHLNGEFRDQSFDRQMPAIDELMQRTYALEEAKVAGNGHVFSFIKDQLDTAFGLRKRQITGEYALKLADLENEFRYSTQSPTALELNDLDSYFRREKWGVEDVTYALDEWMGEKLPLHEAIAFGPSWSFWIPFCEMYKVAQRIKKEDSSWTAGAMRFIGRLFERSERKPRNVSLGSRKSATPDNTGASKREERGKKPIWQRARKLRGRYLRNFVGVDLDSAHAAYRARDELSPEKFDVEGDTKAVGTIKAGNEFNEGDLPRPSHGVIERVEKKGKKTKVHYRLAQGTPEEAQKIMGMKLSAFRAAAAQMYGAELYAALTDSIALEDVNAFVRDEWRELIEGMDDVTVGEAMRIIQGYIINHPKITYHRYTDDPLKESTFSAFQERARDGGAKGKDEYVQTALMLGGGVCAELARIATSVMRLAGIPTAHSAGWKVKKGGRVFVPGHGWPEVVFPNGEGKWHAEPVEVSTIYVSKDLKRSASEAFQAFKEMLAKKDEAGVAEGEGGAENGVSETESSEEESPAPAATYAQDDDVERPAEIRAHAYTEPIDVAPVQIVEPERTPIEDVLHRLPSAWARADAQTRARIAGWVGSLPAIMQLAHRTWPGTETRIVDLIMRNWPHHLNMQRLPQDVDVSVFRRVIQRRVDEADETTRATLDQWARVALRILK